MSFSTMVKNELCRLELSDRCCLLSELYSVIRISGAIRYTNPNGPNIRIITENAAFARRVYSAFKRLYGVNAEVVIRKSRKLKKHLSYIIILTASMGTLKILDDMGINPEHDVSSGNIPEIKPPGALFKKGCCRRAYLRGAFLAGGSISNPEKSYHLEITAHNLELALEIERQIKEYGLNPKIIRRKDNFVVYMKEGENIVDFLNIIGAHNALLELENVRILKDMRNNVNRIVNCETANLDKTVKASIRHIDNIRYIIENGGLESLPDSLKEIARLRIDHPDINLKELGEMLSPPLSKSGVNHRLRKLEKIANDLRLAREE